MAQNHTINIRLGGKGGNGTSNLKTSPKRTIVQMKEINSTKMHIPSALKRFNAKVGGGLGSASALKYAGVAGAIAYGVVGTANKVLDVALDVHVAKTGNTIGVGNIKRVRKYILNPVSYFVDDIYNYGYLQQVTTNRQNKANDYYRELTGKAIVGNQYGNKR